MATAPQSDGKDEWMALRGELVAISMPFWDMTDKELPLAAQATPAPRWLAASGGAGAGRGEF